MTKTNAGAADGPQVSAAGQRRSNADTKRSAADQRRSSADTQRAAAEVIRRTGQVVVGKDEQVRLLLVALAAEGHVLVDDVPGVAKTLLVRTLAAVLGLRFARIQCTPDLLPADVTGGLIYNERAGNFEFRPGPVFTNVVLADEINRATPRTQWAFLEAMQERQVTTDGVTRPLPQPFLVLATQNPVEQKGTFPLPEAQLDRFLFRLSMGYPSEDEELEILERFSGEDPLLSVESLEDPWDVAVTREQVRHVFVDPDIRRYVVGLARATREDADVELGASPRAAVALMRAAQASALLAGRDYVIPDDVRDLAVPALAHRLVLRRDALLERRDAAQVVARLLREQPVPVES